MWGRPLQGFSSKVSARMEALPRDVRKEAGPGGFVSNAFTDHLWRSARRGGSLSQPRHDLFFGPHPLAYRGSHRSRESLYSPNRCRDATALELTYLTAKARKSRGGGGVSSADIGQ